MNEEKRHKLGEIIKEKGIVVQAKPFKLSSGENSYYYYNIKNVALDPVGSNLIGDLGCEIVSSKWIAKSVGGLEVGSIPISANICSQSYHTRNHIQGFFVRKEAKVHGLEREIEGNIEPPIVIVDDVTTTGQSAMQAIEKVKEQGYNIAGVITIVDRDAGASDLFKDNKIEFFPIFEHKYFEDFVDTMINEKLKKEIKTEAYHLF